MTLLSVFLASFSVTYRALILFKKLTLLILVKKWGGVESVFEVFNNKNLTLGRFRMKKFNMGRFSMKIYLVPFMALTFSSISLGLDSSDRLFALSYFLDSQVEIENEIMRNKDYFRECTKEAKVVDYKEPKGLFDIIAGVIGLGNNSVVAQLEYCLANKLQSLTNKICQQKEYVYALARENRDYDSRMERLQIGIDRVEEFHDRHRDWLWNQAKRYYSRSKSDGNAWDQIQANDWEAFAFIFEQESYISCTPNISDARVSNTLDEDDLSLLKSQL